MAVLYGGEKTGQCGIAKPGLEVGDFGSPLPWVD